MTDSAPPFWSVPAESLMEAYGSSPVGLSSAQAAVAHARFGDNVLAGGKEAPALVLLGRQFLSPIVLILVGATVLSGVLGDFTDAVIILAIILLSGLLGFFQERSAGTAMRALLAVVEAKVTVLRDGAPTDLAMSGIVPGDVVDLDAGDLVPGDCVVLDSRNLAADESVLTGETFPAEKSAGTARSDAELTDRTNVLHFGTHIASGTGTALVVRTGRSTELGALSARVSTGQVVTGFERGMTRFGLLLTRFMVVLVILIFAINLTLHRPIIDAALFSLALAVGLTPQLLPAIVSISLSQGARAMARRRVIVRRLDAIEDFGSMSVLCSDKTGTMTEGHVTLDSALGVDGAPSDRVRRLAQLNAALQVGLDSPIDAAIIEAPHSPDITAAHRLDEAPYDFDRRRLSVLVTDAASAPGALLVTKGALDSVLEVCSHAVGADGIRRELAAEEAGIRARFAELSETGLRVLGVATRQLDATAVDVSDEVGMTFEGLLTFADPIKPDAATTIAELAADGVSVRMLTGDNRFVARRIADLVGLPASAVLTGKDIDALDDSVIASAVAEVAVFSELNPLQKERIIAALRASGEVVGYLGDGINDSPALHAADVGISVDTAVPVAKQSASIVLLDKDLRVLLDGIHQGRRTFANTMKYIFMTTSANFGNMLSMAVVSTVLPFLPLLAGQILLVNLLTDLPATSIATDSVDARQLKVPQRWNIRLIRNYMLTFGTLSSVFDLTTFAVLRLGFHAEAAEFRSAWFLGSVITEVGVLFVLRTRGPAWRSVPSVWVVVTSLVVVAVTFALPYSPLSAPLQLTPLPAPLLGLICAIALGYFAATEVTKRFFWPRHARLTSTVPLRPRRPTPQE